MKHVRDEASKEKSDKHENWRNEADT